MFGVGFEHTSAQRSDSPAQGKGQQAVPETAGAGQDFRHRHERVESSAFRHGTDGVSTTRNEGAEVAGA